MFRLDDAFLRGSQPLVTLGLCEARLQDDVRFPWLILIPRREGLAEIEDLTLADRAQLLDEAVTAGAAVRAVGSALGRSVEKLNIGALGNITRQLHLHIVGRRADDAAWPGPVWSHGVTEPYAPDALVIALAAAKAALRG